MLWVRFRVARQLANRATVSLSLRWWPSANLRFLNERSILLLYGWTAVVERQ
jgi:hypothetical protein